MQQQEQIDRLRTPSIPRTIDTIDEGIMGALEGSLTHLEQRRVEIKALQEQFSLSFPIVRDLRKVNDILRSSCRRDLVITELAPQVQYSEYDHKALNNFPYKIEDLFCPVAQTGEGGLSEDEPVKTHKARPLTLAEFDEIILIGGKSTDDFDKWCGQTKVSQQTAYRFNISIGSHPAAIRMLIVIPDFTRSSINTIISFKDSLERRDEEILVAYTLMSQLVSMDDPYVRKDQGHDSWRLCV